MPDKTPNQESDPVETTQPVENVKQPEPKPNTPVVKVEKADIKVYFSDLQLENLVEEEKKITWGEGTTKYGQAFLALCEPEKETTPLWKEQNLKDIQISPEGKLSVNLSLEERPNFGSTGERFMVLSLLQTMFQFEEVTSVQFLIDNQPVETILGHMDVSEPFTKEMMADL
ncbi:GerMN domain-containing protein [Ammoniphilus resinae]|uniref:GerMN domain-containing protein n=1 Tax=Ammoniphilus resinae TaxID=861532 RepID=A0ABS4GK41_9BACL|nr:GerMN domain-containing protein [Ammoniphilus resinae]MBP1930589.1 hypothetical protein [Ammoniphilus resinae]